MSRRWLNALQMEIPARRRSSRGRSARRSPGLERLEDRVVLSPTVYTVNSAAASSTGTGTSGTLPYVLGLANEDTNSDGSEIEFDPTVFSASSPMTITVATTLELSETSGPEIIDGPGAAALTVTTGYKAGVFEIASGVTATLAELTISDGLANLGAGVLDAGTRLTITGCTLTGNHAESGFSYGSGGALYQSGGAVSVTGSTIAKNLAGQGGGTYVKSGTLTVAGSTISGNAAYVNLGADGDGGGVYNAGTLTITGSTLTANKAFGGESTNAVGAGIFNTGTLKVGSSIVKDNNATTPNKNLRGSGGGVFNQGGQVNLSSGCSFVSNTASGGDGGGLYNKSGTVTISGSALSSNKAGAGAAVFNMGTLDVVNSELTDNQGGAVVNSGGSLHISDDTISGNSVVYEGGGIYNKQGSLTVTASVFDKNVTAKNSEGDGGGIFNSGGTASIGGGCTFSNNSAVNGGAIGCSGGKVSISGCTVDHNTASGEGGGLFVLTGTLTITGGTVTDNTALAGGGIYNGEEGTINVTSQCMISSNTAGDGGGIGNYGTFAITDSTIANNLATAKNSNADGGGIWNVGTMTLTDSTVTDNSALASGGATGEGGGIYNYVALLTASGSTFSGNSAAIGGGVDSLSPFTLESCTVTGNTAASGGGIYSYGYGTRTITDSQITNNTATGNTTGGKGGGLYAGDGPITIAGSSFTGNMAAGTANGPGEGGAAYIDDNASITNCSFTNNSATDGASTGSLGGAIAASTGALTLTSCTVSANSADNGGGVYGASDQITISSSELSNNAAANGGAIYNQNGSDTITASTISANSASEDGGGIDTREYLTISGSTVSANSAGADGGGIADEFNAAITNCTIADNAASAGGGLWANGDGYTDTLIALNTTIAYNTVSGGPGSGGGLDDATAKASILGNTIIALNTDGTGDGATPDDIAGTVDGSFDLIGTGGSGGLDHDPNSEVGASEPGLGMLADNGGPTQTIALLPGAAAIGEGSNNPSGLSAPTTDQRGVARASDSVDVGAYQSQFFKITLVPGGTGQSATLNSAFADPLIVSVSSPAGDPVAGGVITFVAPSTGPSATLSSITAMIGSDGEASITATANAIVGAYVVSASATAGSTTDTATFTLTNNAPSQSLVGTTTSLSSSANAPIVGQKLTFTATVAPATGTGTPTGSVTFTIDGQAETPSSLSVVDGVDEATFSTTTLTSGPHTVSAAYSGDPSFAASATTSSLTQTVDADTTTILRSSPNPSILGQSVTFTTTVASTGGGTPTGTVSFQQGSTTLQSVSLDASGQATFTTSTLALGTEAIEAVYAATGDFLGSDSSALMQVVNAASLQTTSTTLATSGNPSTAGQSFTFTATVGSTAGSGTPSGTVTFTIDGKAGSPVALTEVNGKIQATLTMPSPAAGSYTITASYSGDSHFAASTSSTTTQIVDPSPTGPTLVTPGSVDGPTVVSVLRYGYHMMPTKIMLTFDQALDVITAQDDANYRIIGPGGKTVGITAADYDPATLTVTLHPKQRISIHHTYQLIVDGTAPHGLTNTAGLSLDGAEAGHPDSNYHTSLTWRNLVLDPPWPRNSKVLKNATVNLKRQPAPTDKVNHGSDLFTGFPGSR